MSKSTSFTLKMKVKQLIFTESHHPKPTQTLEWNPSNPRAKEKTTESKCVGQESLVDTCMGEIKGFS